MKDRDYVDSEIPVEEAETQLLSSRLQTKNSNFDKLLREKMESHAENMRYERKLTNYI
jgi:hypothetical protein